ncbi:sperm-associated antigen 17 isoform X3 [Narcine bancroftii]|uniref:sperm-associated antigen 17 isoform X3 n=1 Tax=Narcine bancroftii TaxID=1343680 RepID=UPI00383211B9
MPPKKVKSAKKPPSNSIEWEAGLLEAPIEEDRWKPAIYFVMGEKPENEMFLTALSTAVNVPLRKLFSIISWEGTIKQISEFGDKRSQKSNDLPMFYEITEAAWAMLAKGEELPLPLISKLIKFQILGIKQKALKKREIENKPTGEEATESVSAGKKKTDKKSAGKVKGKTEKKSPEPPVAKKTTKLLKRGEVEVIDRCINDEPDDGPQHYIIIQGFQNLQFILLLGELGINISAVIKISCESKNLLKPDPAKSELQHTQTPEAIEGEREQKEAAIKNLEFFWKYLDPVLNSGKPASKLFDVATLQYTVKEDMIPGDWNDDTKLELGAAIFEDIASLIYDCEDWKRQYQNYLCNIKLITVSEASKSEELLALQTPVVTKKPPSANLTPHPEQDTPTLRVDMRYYNDLMNLIPLESLSVSLILHCILEQVVATDESLTPPSELVPKPRKDGLDQSLVDHIISTVLSLPMLEDEKQKIIKELEDPQHMPVNEHSADLPVHNVGRKWKIIEGMDKYEQMTPHKELKQPLLLNLHDNITQRTHHLKVIHGFEPAKVEQEMMKTLPVAKYLNLTLPLSEIDEKRLASIQDLMYYCTSEKLTSSEVKRVFRQFLFESMKFTKVDENGELEVKEDMLDKKVESTYMPWDDPVSFAKEIAHVQKIYSQNNCAELVDTSEVAEMESRRESLTEKEKGDSLKIDIKEIEKLQLRSLTEWCYAEHYDPIVLKQVLQETMPFYRCLERYGHRQDNSTLLVLHNPMNKQRQCKQTWEAALHSDVGFRNYLKYVAYLISDWIEEEEAKYQEELAAKELEAQKLQISQPEVPAEPLPIPEKQKKRKSASGSKTQTNTSRSQSKPETVIEEEDKEKSNETFMREGSLKAWKVEQEKLKEEEQKKDKKGKDRTENKKKEGKVQSARSKGMKSVIKSVKQDPETIREQETISVAVPEVQQPSMPKEEFHKFTGYNFGNDLIQVSGEVKSLFPADGSHIQVKIMNFLHGSTIIQVCVMKDSHNFFIYITDPIKDMDESNVVPTEKTLSENFKDDGKMTKLPTCKCGSFSAVLDDGIILSLSKDAPDREQKKAEDPILAEILNIPSVHAPTTAPITTPPPTAKRDKSSKDKPTPSAKGKHKKETLSSAPVEDPPQPKEEPKMELKQPELGPAPTSEDVADPPVFLCLNACSPDGLLITFFPEQSRGIDKEDTYGERILVRQSYPIKTKGSQPCEAARRRPAMQEASRVITLQGTVVKYMMDGSTEVLFADGTVSRSPDSGPVSVPQSSAVIRDPEGREPKDEKRAKGGPSEEGSKKGKHGYIEQSALRADESPAKQIPSIDPLPGTWITTTPIGLVIGTKGSEKLDIKPILVYKATDPGTGEVMITRQDKVVTVFGRDNTIVEHADGTRITTFFRNISFPEYKLQGETELIPENVTRYVKCIKVECVGFATVLMNWDDCTCSTVFGNGTTIVAKPQGFYQIFPGSAGSLLIDQDGCAVYTSGTNNDIVTLSPISHMESQPGAYFMNYNSPVICEVMDSERNYFQVMLDGNIFTTIQNDKQEQEDVLLQDQMIKQDPITYNKHAPRLFVLHADGSGTELLRSSDVEEYMYQACANSTTAALKEQLPEFPGVLGITFLKPSNKDIGSRWLIEKDVANIIPPNLQSRKWNTFPQTECKVPGPSIGMDLCDQQVHQADPLSPAVLKCPSVLEVRQLFQYEPINKGMQLKMQNCLKEYIELILQREQEQNEMMLKEPRNEEEVTHAGDLLKLVLSFPEDELGQKEEREEKKALLFVPVDVASIYKEAVASTFKNTSKGHTCEWTEVDSESNGEQNHPSRWPQRIEQYRQELEVEKATKLALKNKIVPPYFLSEPNTSQRCDMDYLPMCNSSPYCDSEMDFTKGPTYPTPFLDMGSGTCHLKGRDSPMQQEVTSQLQYPNPDFINKPSFLTSTGDEVTGTCSLKWRNSPTKQAVGSQNQRLDFTKGPTYPTPFLDMGSGTCHLKGRDSPMQQEVTSQLQYPNPDARNRFLHPLHATSVKKGCPKNVDVPEPRAITPQCHNSTINGMLKYKPEELPADGRKNIFHKSLVINAANLPRKEKVKLPTAILSSKPFLLPNQRFAVTEEPVRRKVNTVSVAGPIASGLLKEPTRGFEIFPREVNFGVLQEGFTYAYTVSLKNVGIDSCRYRIKQPPPSTGLRVYFKPGPVAAGLKTDLEIKLYAMAIGLESNKGAGYLCHHVEIQTEAEVLFLPITATVLTEYVYKNRPEEFPKDGKAAGVRLICTDPIFHMDIIHYPQSSDNRSRWQLHPM